MFMFSLVRVRERPCFVLKYLVSRVQTLKSSLELWSVAWRPSWLTVTPNMSSAIVIHAAAKEVVRRVV